MERIGRNRLQHHSVEQEMFVRFNTRALDKQQQFQHSSTSELLIDHTAVSIDSDEEGEEKQQEECDSDHDVDMADAPPPPLAASSSAAAAAAAPIRSRSELDALGDEWLLQYARDHNILASTKWGREMRNAVEAAALSVRFPLGTGADMVKRIHELLTAAS